jgi:hypothetical protein
MRNVLSNLCEDEWACPGDTGREDDISNICKDGWVYPGGAEREDYAPIPVGMSVWVLEVQYEKMMSPIPVRMSGWVLEVQDENMMSAWCLMVKVDEQSEGRDS